MNPNTNDDLTRRGPVLVLGATGKTGRRVAENLEAMGVSVRRGSRSATPSFDWNHEATWDACLDGVEAAPKDFADYAKETAATDVWRVAA